MARLPAADQNSERDYATFTSHLWGDLDGWYNFWAERWRRTMDYLRSQHWRMLQEVDIKQIPDWRRFPIANFTLALYNDYLKNWLQSRVRFSAIPESPQAEDLAAGDIADYALRYAWDILDMENKRIDIGAWLIATGNASVRVYWDTDTGNMVPLAEPGPDGTIIPLDPQTLQPDPTRQTPALVDAGEINIEVISPQAVRRPTTKQHGVMTGFTISYDDAVSRYSKEIAEKLQYTSSTASSVTLDILSPLSPYRGDMKEDRALVVEHYIPRSRRYPQGLWWTGSNEMLVTMPAPLPAGRCPVVSFRWIPVPGHPFFGMSPLYDQTFTNKVYDEMLARSLEWANKVVPKTLLPSGGGLRVGDLTDEPGQELVVQPGAEPSYTATPEPPEMFERLRSEAREDMLIVGGYRFSRPEDLPPGEATTRVRKPPTTINQGQEVALAQINSKAAWEELGYVLLSYMGKYYDDGRVAMIAGPDRQYQWRELKASALKDLRARLHVDEIPLYPWNKQSMQDSVVAMLNTQAGQFMFTDASGQIDRERLEAAIQAVGLDTVFTTTDPDVLEARNESYAFQGAQEGQEPPQVRPWQSHEVHIAEHSKELKSLKFATWAKEAQQAFLQHVSEHEELLAEAAKKQAAQMIEQERALREVRAQSESERDVRIAVGEELIKLFSEVVKEGVKKELGTNKKE